MSDEPRQGFLILMPYLKKRIPETGV